MKLKIFLDKLKEDPSSVSFEETIATIEASYSFTPTTFENGLVKNKAGENNGSCKVFAFAAIHGLTERQTLACFGDYYRKDVLESPEKDDHQNIRNFIKNGWAGISFAADALIRKEAL